MSSYLNKLQFNEKLNNSVIANYFKNPRLLILFTLTILILGITSYINLPRVLYPEIKIPVVVVTTALPGASPSDVESLISIPLEDKIKGLTGLKTYQSISRESASILYLEFNTGLDADKVKTDVQSAVDSVTTLPADALTPEVVKLDFENQPVWTFALVSNGDAGSLIRFANILEEKIKSLPVVDKVETTGLEEQEIQLLIKPEAFSTYQLNPSALASSISGVIQSYPAGTVNTDKSTITLSIDKGITSIDDFRNIIISVNGKQLKLGDIAIISERSKPEQIVSYAAKTNEGTKQTAITFNVYRNSNTTIDKSVKEVRQLVNEELTKYNGQFSVLTKNDQSQKVDVQFNRLIHDLTFTIFLIVATLLLFLGAKQALVASISVPLSFLITFSLMKLLGVSMSTVAVLSLLLALGLLVDDTIVVISAMTTYYKTGKFTPMQTALLVWKDFIIPIITTTLTTIYAFLPLIISSGLIGEFIKPLPIVTSSALASSFIVAIFIIIPFMTILLKPNIPSRVKTFLIWLSLLAAIGLFYLFVPKTILFIPQLLVLLITITIFYLLKNPLVHLLEHFMNNRVIANSKFQILVKGLDSGFLNFEILTKKYKGLIEKIINSSKNRKNAIIITLVFCLLSYSLVPLGIVKSEFFPKTNQDLIYINLEMPEGTNIQTTSTEALKLLPQLQQTQDLDFISLDLGKIYTSGINFTGTGYNKAFFTLNLFPKEQRKSNSSNIAQSLREELSNFKNGTLSVVEPADGPPAGGDLEISFYGDDLGELDNMANKLISFLKTQEGVANVSKNVKVGISKIAFVPDKTRISQAGLDYSTVGGFLRMYTSGYKADEIKLNGQTEDVTIRFTSGILSPEDITELNLPSQSGYISVASLGDLKLEPNPSLVLREDGIRTITVTASVLKGYSITDKNKDVTNYINNTLKVPNDYSWKSGGSNEENVKATTSVLYAMVIAIVLITSTMIIQFGSFRKALVVIMAIPLSISGVFLLFALTRTTLSFPASIGILALMGIVVKNSILVVDKISANIKTGMPYVESIVDGASSRLEAIGLTSIAAILGLVPITISDPLWRGVGGAIISGLSFSGIIILIFIPTVYYFFFRGEDYAKL